MIMVLGLLGPTAALPASTVTDVTPDNIASQRLTLRVEHEKFDGGSFVEFRIYVSSGVGDVSSRHDARFVIWKEKVVARSGPFHAKSSRPSPVAVCSVREYDKSGVLHYEVQVGSELLDRSTFTFLNWDPSGMPAFDAYEIILREFSK